MRALVLGSGLAGITAAYYLRQRGCDVTVVDRAAGPARETSYANGSMITPSLADPWNSPGVFRVLLRSLGRDNSPMLLRPSALPSLVGWGIAFLRNSSQRNFERNYLANVGLVHYSQWIMRDLLQTHPLEFDHAYDGTVKIFRDAAAHEYGVKVAHWLKQAGVQHRLLDRPALLDVEPALHAVIDRICGGIAYPGDETGNARLFCEELRRICAGHGVTFRYGENVVAIAADRQRVTGLRTAKETLAADVYVLAAGSFSAFWAKQLRFNLPVRPAKGYSISLPMHRWDGRPRVPIVDDSLHAALVPVGGVLRVAGTAEFAGYDTTLRSERIANLLGLLRRVYPQFAESVANIDVQPWCGLRPLTPDGMPIIGRTPLENFFVNTGHGPLGWSMACGSGKAVADIATGGATDVDLSAFALTRF
jgi:D-amino-acid dehydrogenase